MRRIQVALLSFLLIFFISGCGITARQSLNNTDISSMQLSKEEKLEDFEYMYNVLKDNYPFFEVNKRLSGHDWLQMKGSYKDCVSSTSSDDEFYKALDKMLCDLHNGHTQMLEENAYRAFRDDFINLSNEKDRDDGLGNNYEAWAKELNKEEAKRRYLFRYNGNDTTPRPSGSIEKSRAVSNNLYVEVIQEEKIAYVAISSFSGFHIEKDMKLMKSFLEKVREYPVLIIDIRGNGGGSTLYWFDSLVPMLINKPLKHISYHVFRGGAFTEAFIKNGYKALQKIENIDKEGLKNLPPEVKSDFNYYVKEERIIQPKESVGFNGKIYLLVDGHVYSASESFAEFAKSTGFATTVGQKTGGDGIGRTPIVCTLPNSGYVFRFPVVLGLTADGTCNEEFKTQPDIEVLSPNTQFYWTDGVIQKVMELEK